MRYDKLFAVFAVFVLVGGFVSAEDTYVESLAKIRDQIAQSEENIKTEINSFNGAFSDTFRLVDDEISRLIFANAAMVGLVFAIMFLVYAKTSTRSRRDMQVMLIAHSKHIDSMVSGKLDDFTRRIEAMLEEKKKQDLSTLESLDDQIKGLSSVESFDRKPKTVVDSAVSPQATKLSLGGAVIQPKQSVVDERVVLPKEPSKPGVRFLRRLKLGMMKLLGKRKTTEKTVEFKLKK